MRQICGSAMIVLGTLVGTIALACADPNSASRQPTTRATSAQQEKVMKVRMTIEGTTVTATLDDNGTARDFASLLPMTLTLKDYAATEKISDLPKKLSTHGAPRSYKPIAGDITYYAPWGNLALFYKDGKDSSGLVRLGSIDTGVEPLRRAGPLKVTIEQIKE
jgi:hypothetical protein